VDVQEALFKYVLRLADNSLILGHRLSEYSSWGPILEEDIASTNIALDLVGRSRFFYQLAAEIEGKGRTEDDLAYKRAEREFYNHQLVEQPNGDFGYMIIRQFLIDAFEFFYYTELQNSSNQPLADIATKSLKEITYHLRHCTQWMIRLGDGTEESHQRAQKPLNELWMFTGEMFDADEIDTLMLADGIAPDLSKIKPQWYQRVNEVLAEATLQRPEDAWMQKGGKQGLHTEHLGFLLAELQYLPRAYPDAQW